MKTLTLAGLAALLMILAVPDPASGTHTYTTRATYDYGVVEVGGHSTDYWRLLALRRTRQLRATRREVRHLSAITRDYRPNVRTAIRLGAIAYRQNAATLLRKAECESGLWPFARNNGSSDSPMGLFQFRPSTWRSTPFGFFSIWDTFAQALAAGWRHAVGRGREWACR